MGMKNGKSGCGMEIEDYVLTATENESAHMERPLEKKWFDIFWYVLLILIFILMARVTYLTIIKGGYYQELSKGNSIRSLVIKAPRGRIFDRYGSLLVSNIPSVDIVAIPFDLPEDGEARKFLAQKLANLIKINEGEVIAKIGVVENKSINPILVKESITQDQMLLFLEKEGDFPGIRIEKTAVREYADSVIFSHILGYEGKVEKKELENNPDYLFTDYIGKNGIEKTYESDLRGTHGALQVEVDARGNVKREVGIINPKSGSDLILSIDAQLQKKLYDTLSAHLEKARVKTGAAVALNPKNGEVLALVTLPSYDNNLFSQKISQGQYLELINNPDKPLFNRVISGEYAPGSVMKPVTAIGALAEGVITPSTIINGMGGVLRIGSFSFRDWKTHGPSDVRLAIAESNDIFFYLIGGGYGNIQGMGIDRMKKYYNMFGYGNLTGIDIPGEANGFIPDKQWKMDTFGEKWYVGNDYHASIGQGYITATPLQIANSIATIANGGTRYQPHIVSQIRRSDAAVIDIAPKISGKVNVSSEFLQISREGMRQAVTEGTAQQLKDLSVKVAGKTGTAQFGGDKKVHSWFASFAPYDNPEIVMAILMEGKNEDNISPVPITKEVYDWYFNRDKK